MTLRAGKTEDPIPITLTEVPFPADGKSPDPVFEALSYVWGSEDNPPHIHVESRQPQGILSVTQNLAKALPYLQYPDQDRILWIDAICVNQQDLDERSKQVQRMGDVYSHAHHVVCMLGPEEDKSCHAINLLNWLATRVKVDWKTQELSAASTEFNEWADRPIPLPYNDATWLAIYKLLLRPWFDRPWIQQEVRLAKEVLITCGRCTATWEDFYSATCVIFFKPSSRRFDSRADSSLIRKRIDVITEFAFHCDNYARIRFPDLLYETKHCQCSDLKAWIFPILGMVEPHEREKWSFTPNYSLSIDQTYINASVSYMIATRSLNLLRYCELGRRQGQLKIPSWVTECGTLKHFPRQLANLRADGYSISRSQFDADTPISSGILVDIVDTAASIELDDVADSKALFAAIQNMIRNFLPSLLNVATLAPVLVAGELDDT